MSEFFDAHELIPYEANPWTTLEKLSVALHSCAARSGFVIVGPLKAEAYPMTGKLSGKVVVYLSAKGELSTVSRVT